MHEGLNLRHYKNVVRLSDTYIIYKYTEKNWSELSVNSELLLQITHWELKKVMFFYLRAVGCGAKISYFLKLIAAE